MPGRAPRAGKVAGQGATRVKIAGNAAIPAGVTAVALNVTVTDTTDSGYVTAWPGDPNDYRPGPSNLNYTADQSVPNLVIVPVGPDGYGELFNGGAKPVHLLADVTGYFTRSASSGYTTLTSVRFADTHEGLGAPKRQLAAQSAVAVQIGGLRGVPKAITAVALNVTATNPKGLGHLAVYPGGGPVPTTSSLNFAAGQPVANAVIVPVGADGTIKVFNGAWLPTDVVIDVVGYYSKDSKDSKAARLPFTPYRALDTREEANGRPGGKLKARQYVSQGVHPRGPGRDRGLRPERHRRPHHRLRLPVGVPGRGRDRRSAAPHPLRPELDGGQDRPEPGADG